MALNDFKIWKKLLELREDHVRVDHDNERSISRSLFVSGILQVTTSFHHWVIDALDECSNPSSLFDSILAKMDESTPLRVLVTSRETLQLQTHFSALGHHQYQRERISTDETLPDIERIVATKAETLVLTSEKDRALLVQRIIDKSKGSFLWTILVLDELTNSYSEEDINQILDEVPRGMEPLYGRALEMMSRATRGKPLAKAILMWVTCVVRPLPLKELETALEIYEGQVSQTRRAYRCPMWSTRHGRQAWHSPAGA